MTPISWPICPRSTRGSKNAHNAQAKAAKLHGDSIGCASVAFGRARTSMVNRSLCFFYWFILIFFIHSWCDDGIANGSFHTSAQHVLRTGLQSVISTSASRSDPSYKTYTKWPLLCLLSLALRFMESREARSASVRVSTMMRLLRWNYYEQQNCLCRDFVHVFFFVA